MSSSSLRSSCRSISLDEIRHEDGSVPFQFNKAKILGIGGEAIVYLACLYTGQKKTLIAVKQLKYIHGFESEIQTMSKIHHSNTVSLLGYCDQSGEKILIYEYMEKGSLTNYVIPKAGSIILSWKQRLNICLGAARGLQYLHTKTVEFPKGIIHRDIKPDNILINENWVGKIADFGMVKLSHADQVKSTMITNIRGTMGFYAPEYLSLGTVSRKIDVYAFGVVLFYVLCLKSPWDRVESYFRREDEDLGHYAQQCIDTRIKEEISDDSLKVYTDIIQGSLQLAPNLRPDMDTVVLELKKALKCQNLQDEAKRGTSFSFDDIPMNCPPGGEGKVVLYTSLGAIRKTNVACNAVREILADYHVKFEERDSSQDPNLSSELRKLVGKVTYPRLFMMGREIALDKLHQNDQLFKSIQAITSN